MVETKTHGINIREGRVLPVCGIFYTVVYCTALLFLQFYCTILDCTRLYSNTMVKCHSGELSDSHDLARQRLGTAGNCTGMGNRGVHFR